MPELPLTFNRPNYHTVKLHSLPLSVPYQIIPLHKLLRGGDRRVFPQVFQPSRPAQRTPIIFVESADGAYCKADSRSCLTLKGYNQRSWIETDIGRWDTNGNERIACAASPSRGMLMPN